MNKAETMTKKHEKERPLMPRLRFPEFQDTGEWEWKKLDSICERIVQKVTDAALTPVSITAGQGFVSQKSKFGRNIAGEQYKNYILLRHGDFAYNKGNSKKYPQGYVCQLKEFEQAAASSAFLCFRLLAKHEANFFQGLFDENIHGKQLARHITSSARSDGLLNIKPEIFFNILLPIPQHYPEQQKIADCLSSLDESISAETNKLDALKAHKKGLLEQIFPAEGESVPSLRFLEFQDAGEWEEKPLAVVADYENGKAYEPHIVENGKYVVVNSRFISTDGAIKKHSNEPMCIARCGDVLMVLSDLPNGRALAKCYYADADDLYAVNQRVCRLEPHSIDGKFLCFLLNRHPKLLAFDDGINQTHLKKNSVLQCPLNLPFSLDEQQKIADCLSSLDELIAAQTQKIDLLKTHKKGLTQQLFPAPDEAQA